MKRIIPILLLVLSFNTGSFAKGAQHLSYEVSVSSDNPQMQQMQSMMDGSKMDMYSNGKFSRTDFNMGSMMQMTSIIDYDSKQSLSLISGMSGKMAITASLADLKKKTEENQNIKVKLIDSTKEIAGFPCKKASITLPEGMTLDMWYTTKINMGDLSGTSLDYKGIPGTPMEFMMKKGQMIFKYTATKYEPNVQVDAHFFDMTAPAGYKVISAEDLKNMGK